VVAMNEATKANEKLFLAKPVRKWFAENSSLIVG
jgi:hypothetical protein